MLFVPTQGYLRIHRRVGNWGRSHSRVVGRIRLGRVRGLRCLVSFLWLGFAQTGDSGGSRLSRSGASWTISLSRSYGPSSTATLSLYCRARGPTTSWLSCSVFLRGGGRWPGKKAKSSEVRPGGTEAFRYSFFHMPKAAKGSYLPALMNYLSVQFLCQRGLSEPSFLPLLLFPPRNI